MLLEEITNYEKEMIALRHDFHSHPELGFEEVRTSQKVAELLTEWGYEVHRSIAKTGIVGTLKVGTGTKRLGIRADMDALPILQQSDLPFASKIEGLMHACGHDGHTTILLSAARYLAQSRNFNGTLNLIFQPAEEGFGGAEKMLQDGLLERFPCDAVFALHNFPQIPLGTFMARSGAMLASSDSITITLYGKGGHASMPSDCIDPTVAGASIIMALQTIVARNVKPVDAAVITVGSFISGTTHNVIPDSARLQLSVRTLSPQVRELVNERIRQLVTSQAESYGLRAELVYDFGYPVLMNHQQETQFALEVAREVFGDNQVVPEAQVEPVMGSEDFAFFLEKCPGTYIIMGTGEEGFDYGLHHPKYQFNDQSISIGATYWARLTERFLR